MNTQELITHAISLPVEERAFVIDSLLRSLHQPDMEIDKKWAAVAQRRLDELKTGSVQAIPGNVVFEKIWAKFA